MMIRPWLWLPATLAFAAMPAQAQEDDLRKAAMKLHEAAGGSSCERMEGAYVPEGEENYAEWTLSYTPSWDPGSDPESVTLIRIFCSSGAYNVQHAYYWYQEYDGLRPLPFAVPLVDVTYENDDIVEGKVLEVSVIGFRATTTLVNSEFDPDTLTLTSHSYWRGMGDASSTGVWVFSDGDFGLVHYDVDASYDGEVNPQTMLDYSAGE